MKNHKVIFRMDRPDHELPDDHVYIFPTGKWDDFDYKTQCYFRFKGEDGEPIQRKFMCAFMSPTPSPADVIAGALKINSGVEISADRLPPFFSMQLSMDEYRQLVTRLGPGDARQLLLALSDMVALRHQPKVESWVSDAARTEVFNLSLTRQSEPFFAYFNAASILSGVQNEDVSAISTQFLLEFKLNCFSTAHHFEFMFDKNDLIPANIAVIIGENGTGKSQSLNRIAQSLINGDNAFAAVGSKRPLISRLIAISTPGETASTFPEVPSKDGKIKYLRLTAAPNEKENSGGATLPEIILQLARDQRTIGKHRRFQLFRDAANQVVPFDSLYLSNPNQYAAFLPRLEAPVKIAELTDAPEKIRLDNAQRVNRSGQLVRRDGDEYFPLSSGQISFLRLAAQMALHVENATLFLIDEPETHMHPSLITRFVAMLNTILDQSGSLAIVATHSAYLVREVKSGQVHTISRGPDNQAHVVKPRLRTFGADVGALSHFVFGDEIANKLIDDVVDKLRASIDPAPLIKQLQSEISTEAMIYLNGLLRQRTENEAS